MANLDLETCTNNQELFFFKKKKITLIKECQNELFFNFCG